MEKISVSSNSQPNSQSTGVPKQRVSKTIKKISSSSCKGIKIPKTKKSGRHSKRKHRTDEQVLDLNVVKPSSQESVPAITTADYVNNSFAVKEL